LQSQPAATAGRNRISQIFRPSGLYFPVQARPGFSSNGISTRSNCHWIVWPDNARASPFGVPWSKRTSTGGDWSSAQALSHELKYRRHLLARHVELLDDLVDAEIREGTERAITLSVDGLAGKMTFQASSVRECAPIERASSTTTDAPPLVGNQPTVGTTRTPVCSAPAVGSSRYRRAPG